MSVERIRRAVEAAVPGWFGESAVTRWPDGPARHTWSYQFRPEVVVPGGTATSLVVKVPIWAEAPTLEAALDAGPQEDTKAEAAALEAIAEAIDGDGLAAIRVRGYLPEINAIVMDRFDGLTLRRLVGDPRRWGRVPGTLGRAGRWLRAYHDRVAGVAIEPFSPDPLLDVAEEAFGAPGGRRAGEAVVRVRCGLHGLAGHPVAMTRTHGDFTLANLIVSADGDVAALDPNRYPGPALADLARLIVDLRMHRLRAATLGLTPSRRRVTTWEAALLDGYGDLDREALAVLVGVAALERVAEVKTPAAGPLRRLTGPLVRRHRAAELALAARGLSSRRERRV